MKPQTPAAGIMMTNDFGKSKSFVIGCKCGGTEHMVNMWIEVEGDEYTSDVQVSFYVEPELSIWDSGFKRLRVLWDLLVRGTHKQSHEMILDKQSAINLANTIASVVTEMEKRKI
jgi:hypothetical protein